MLSEFRHTLRSLGRSPGFVVVAVLTLALGIGVNGAMFGIVNGVLIRGLPFGDPEQLVAVETGRPAGNESRSPLSPLELADLRGATKSFEELTGYNTGTVNLSGPGAEPERVSGCNFIGAGASLLRVPTILGRWFTADEDKPGAEPKVVLGYAVWANRFQSDPAIVGKQVKLNGEWATIVGVAPQRFRFPAESDLWRPMRFAPDRFDRDSRGFYGLGRLKPNVTLAQAQAELAGIARRWEQDFPEASKERTLTARPLHDRFVDDSTRRMVSIMFGAVMLVLLIACANVANLLLARAAVRQKEICLRAALGAGRGQLVRLLLAEACVLAGAGALLGLPLAHGLLVLLTRHLIEKQPPFWMVFKIDAVSIGYLALLALLTCLVAGLWPAWRASRADLNVVLKDGGRGATGFSLSRFTRLMVIVEVALSSVLLVLSGLAIRTVIKMQTTPLGFTTNGVFTCRIALPPTTYKETVRQQQFYRDLLERLGARPEIAAVSLSTLNPTWRDRARIQIEGKPRAEPGGAGAPAFFASRAVITGNYFATMGIELAQGRVFDERDAPDAPPAVIVSTRFAALHWPGENALGKRFAYGTKAHPKPGDWVTVVGVVAPTLQGEFEQEGGETPQSYTPVTQEEGLRYVTVFAKARNGDAVALASIVRATVRTLDEDLPVYFVQTLDHMVEDAKFFKKLFAWIFGLFGGVALVLAAVGLYGVMSYSVSQRTQEIGVRMALGAEPGDVLVMILREGGGRLLIGLVLGLVAAFFSGQLLAFVLWGVSPRDGVTFAATFVTLALTGLIACLVPALRALRVNPVEALRCE